MRIRSLIPILKSSNTYGITPYPYKSVIFSNNMWIASQLVRPPDKANNPAMKISVEYIGENIPYIVMLKAKIFVIRLLFIYFKTKLCVKKWNQIFFDYCFTHCMVMRSGVN